jgi:4-hydroxybenzoate polyprenyltransferase
MKVVMNVYQYVNILSLDVAAGAVICSLFFARIFHVAVSPNGLVALALTVWVIYTIDHLRDAKTIKAVASTDRHRFHQKYFRLILAILYFVIAVNFLLIWFVPQRVLIVGLALWLIVVVYLVSQRYLKFLKEFFVALLYTAGILLPSLSVMTLNPLTVHWVLIGKFFITALMNLLLFSLFDYKEDRDQNQHSFVTWFGPASTRTGILLLGLVNILLGIGLWSFDPGAALIFISMNMMLLAILFFQKHLISDNYYRIFGDAVFFIPLLYLL